jgi:CBS-domain-containing membrane protein
MLNLAFFLIPKRDVIWLSLNATMRQALERMEHHGYSAIPLLDEQGRYAKTLTDRDLLLMLKYTPALTFNNTDHIKLADVPCRTRNEAVSINADMGDLLQHVASQNFVPVTDDLGVFIGIVRRREVIEYCIDLIDRPTTSIQLD